MTVQSTEEIPGGTQSCNPDPFPTPPPPPASSHRSFSLIYNSALAEMAFPPSFLNALALGKIFCFLLSDHCTSSMHDELQEKGKRFLPHCLFPIYMALDRQHEHSWRKVWSQV